MDTISINLAFDLQVVAPKDYQARADESNRSRVLSAFLVVCAEDFAMVRKRKTHPFSSIQRNGNRHPLPSSLHGF